MRADAVVLQRKIMGVLMRAGREKAHRTVNEVAQRLGITAARIRQYERGDRSISLPELERLALFLQVPLSFFISSDSTIQKSVPRAPSHEETRTRRAALGVKLKQARFAAGKSREECAKAIGRTPATISRYELGASDIPITELEQLAQLLQVTPFYFVDEKTGGSVASDVLDLDKLSRLPKEVRAFVLNPDNLPYLRMSIKFGELPTDRLKELGEILLVVH
ncbi:MAG: helix-turn-helix domain-containing protein [Chloroflexi bacterium]|nr:helix-turn-helix domain-containing protein [Chloroflexota bacterium]